MLNRRHLFLGLAALPLVPLTAKAQAHLEYTYDLVVERLASGETLLLDFYASWCSTCRAQARVIEALRQENPAYDAAITFVRVDWDEHRRSQITQQLQIPRRSTLVLLRGEQELGRIVAGTRRADIQALLDLGVA